MTSVSTITGLAEVERALAQLPGKMAQRKVVEKALRSAGKVIATAAHDNLVAQGAVETGIMASTIRIVRREEQIPGQVMITVKPSTKLFMVVRPSRHSKLPVRYRPSKVAHWIEYGTFRTRAKPFFRPAVDGKAEEAIRIIRDDTLAGIAAAARGSGLKVSA